MGLSWDWNDKLGTCKVMQNIRDKDEEFELSIYRGNAFAIFVYHYEERGEKYYNVSSFFTGKDHAKKMLGLDKKDKENYGNNLLDSHGWERYTEFVLDPRRKEAKELAKLLIAANWREYPIIRFEEGGEE